MGETMAIVSGILQQKSNASWQTGFSNYAFWVIDGRRVDKLVIDDYLDSLCEIGKPIKLCRLKHGLVTAVETMTGEKVKTRYLRNVFASLLKFNLIAVYALLSLPFMIVGGPLGFVVLASLIYLYPARGYFKANRETETFLGSEQRQ